MDIGLTNAAATFGTRWGALGLCAGVEPADLRRVLGVIAIEAKAADPMSAWEDANDAGWIVEANHAIAVRANTFPIEIGLEIVHLAIQLC